MPQLDVGRARFRGCPDRLIKAIVSHGKVGMTFGRYSERPEWRDAVDCIEGPTAAA